MPGLAAPHVLPHVVEVDVDRGGVAAGRPLLGGGLEHHVDLAVVVDLAADQRADRLVDVVDHGAGAGRRRGGRMVTLTASPVEGRNLKSARLRLSRYSWLSTMLSKSFQMRSSWAQL